MKCGEKLELYGYSLGFFGVTLGFFGLLPCCEKVRGLDLGTGGIKIIDLLVATLFSFLLKVYLMSSKISVVWIQAGRVRLLDELVVSLFLCESSASSRYRMNLGTEGTSG